MGLPETEGSVTVKINRGAFPAWFLFAVMKAIGVNTLWLHGGGLIVLGLVTATSSGAQPVAIAHNKDSEQNYQNSKTLTPSPLQSVIVNVEPSAYESETPGDQQPGEGNIMGEPPDFWVAVFTAVLSISTVLLWISTNKSAGAAIRAAEIAERALVDLERPFVYCQVTKHGIEIRDIAIVAPGAPSRRTVISRRELELTTFNLGRTPAQLTRLHWQVVLSANGGICDPVDPKIEGGRELPIGAVCVPDRPFLEPGNIDNFGPEDDDAILNNQKSIWIIGFVRYDDIFGKHYINGFAFVYEVGAQSFRRRGGESYNYQRREQPTDIPLFSSSLN